MRLLMNWFAQADQSSVAAPVSPQRALINQYCTGCHSDRVRSGGLALSQLDLDAVVGRPRRRLRRRTAGTSRVSEHGGSKQQGSDHGVCSMQLGARHGRPPLGVGQQLTEAAALCSSSRSAQTTSPSKCTGRYSDEVKMLEEHWIATILDGNEHTTI